MTGRALTRAGHADSGGLGAAPITAVTAGPHPSVKAAAKALARPGKRFEPDRSTVGRREQGFADYRRVYQDLKDFNAERAARG